MKILVEMLTLNLLLIRSKIKEYDMSKIKGEFIGSLGLGYVSSAAPKDYTFYTIPEESNSLLVSVDAMRVRLSFPLDAFVIDYLQAFSLTPIHLTPTS